MRNIDWEYEQILNRLTHLKELGYEFFINANGYKINYDGKFIYGAGVKLPRQKKLSASQARANIKDFARYAAVTAERHFIEMKEIADNLG